MFLVVMNSSPPFFVMVFYVNRIRQTPSASSFFFHIKKKKVPSKTNTAPRIVFQVNASPSIKAENIKTKIILERSRAATAVVGPDLSAIK